MEENKDNKDSNINLTILNEISKSAQTGMNSISFLLNEVSEENMKENLVSQYAEYGKISDRINTQFEKYGEIPDNEPLMQKVMGWTGVKLNTMSDKSNSHIAEIMIQGGSLGIIECQKLLNHNPQADQEVKNILNDFMQMQQNDINKMKSFL